jgi:integrase
LDDAAPGDRLESLDVASLTRMLYRFAGAVRRAAREETFVAVVGAAIALVLTGTVVDTLGEGWSLVDGFYFAVCTLTTSSIADPELAVKTITNHLNFAHGVFAFALKRGLVTQNAVAMTDRPPSPPADPDVRFLDREELEALLRAAAAEDLLGPTDRALWLTAAMTGLRQGELAAVRWRDVDWSAGLIRVRRSYSRGQYTTPKSRRSSRAVPMADRVAGELERQFKRSAYTHDDDLVFCHPHSGRPYDASKSRVRFKQALERAGLRPLRFHDLRHTYGTLMAAAGTPLRTLQGWMGHRDYKTTEIYADFAPDPTQGALWAQLAFGDEPTDGGSVLDRERASDD